MFGSDEIVIKQNVQHCPTCDYEVEKKQSSATDGHIRGGGTEKFHQNINDYAKHMARDMYGKNYGG